MNEGTAREATEILAAAREWMREWAAEGVDQYERPEVVALPAEPSPERSTSPATGAGEVQSPQPRAASTEPPRAAAPQPEPAAETHAGLGARPTLEEVRDFLGDCRRCGLHEGRSTIVFGDGNPDADLMFVGEGPGEQEDRQGLPFVGRAGELLTQMIEKGIETPRRDVYICNIVKCRPPGNRNPLPDEVAACRAFLDGQIDSVRPKVIVTLGKPAASLLLGRDVAITRVRGTWQQYRGIPLMPTLHPAFILRQYTPENRRLVWEDLKAAAARTRA